MTMLKSGIKKCPHCGYDEFYVRATVSGSTLVFYNFNGNHGDNT